MRGPSPLDSDPPSASSSMRSALRAEPERLRAERTSLASQIQALSMSNFQVHVANFHCEEHVRGELRGAVGALPSLSGVVSGLASDADGLEGDLARLHGEHTRLRRTLAQHNALLELLEAPSIMEACVRSGSLDEALDVADYATSLFFSHKLWAGGSAGGAGDIVGQVVREIRALASELRENVLSQLAGGRVTLPLVLKLLAHLRRLYTQQALARKRAGAQLAAAAGGGAAGAGLAAAAAAAPQAPGEAPDGSGGVHSRHTMSAAAFTMTPEEDAAIVRRVRLEFLGARDTWHRGELDAIPRHNVFQYILRVVEAQRSQWADIASQYSAVCNTIRPTSAALGPGADAEAPGAPAPAAASAALSAAASAAAALSLAADQASARALLSDWVRGRSAWFLPQLRGACGALEEGANLASLLSQATYAARRAGRIGADYSHLLPPIFAQRAEALLSERLRCLAATFAEDLAAWAWAFKLGHDPNATTTSAPGEAPAGAPGASSGLLPLAPPLALMRFAPLADATNGLLTAYTAVRALVPVASAPEMRAAVMRTLDALYAAAAAAPSAAASPLAPFTAGAGSGAGGGRGGGGSGGGSGGGGAQPAGGKLSEDDAAAARRYCGLVRALGDTLLPYFLLVTQHLTGGTALARTGFDNPAADTQSLDAAVAARSLGDADLDFAWSVGKQRSEAIVAAVVAAAHRGGMRGAM